MNSERDALNLPKHICANEIWRVKEKDRTNMWVTIHASKIKRDMKSKKRDR
jgi:hypothetical protein